MKRATRDMTTLAFSAPMVAGVRMMQMATGSMTPAEFTRMWIEKPLALASGVAALQTEMALATVAALGDPLLKPRTAARIAGSGLRPFASAVAANRRRLRV